MVEPLQTVFTWFYRGRHDPEDAWWWLSHPADTTPAGTAPVQQQLLEGADALDRQGLHEAATALREVTAEVLAADRRTASDALLQAQRYLQPEARTTCIEQHSGSCDDPGTPLQD